MNVLNTLLRRTSGSSNMAQLRKKPVVSRPDAAPEPERKQREASTDKGDTDTDSSDGDIPAQTEPRYSKNRSSLSRIVAPLGSRDRPSSKPARAPNPKRKRDQVPDGSSSNGNQDEPRAAKRHQTETAAAQTANKSLPPSEKGATETVADSPQENGIAQADVDKNALRALNNFKRRAHAPNAVTIPGKNSKELVGWLPYPDPLVVEEEEPASEIRAATRVTKTSDKLPEKQRSEGKGKQQGKDEAQDLLQNPRDLPKKSRGLRTEPVKEDDIYEIYDSAQEEQDSNGHDGEVRFPKNLLVAHEKESGSVVSSKQPTHNDKRSTSRHHDFQRESVAGPSPAQRKNGNHRPAVTFASDSEEDGNPKPWMSSQIKGSPELGSDIQLSDSVFQRISPPPMRRVSQISLTQSNMPRTPVRSSKSLGKQPGRDVTTPRSSWLQSEISVRVGRDSEGRPSFRGQPSSSPARRDSLYTKAPSPNRAQYTVKVPSDNLTKMKLLMGRHGWRGERKWRQNILSRSSSRNDDKMSERLRKYVVIFTRNLENGPQATAMDRQKVWLREQEAKHKKMAEEIEKYVKRFCGSLGPRGGDDRRASYDKETRNETALEIYEKLIPAFVLVLNAAFCLGGFIQDGGEPAPFSLGTFTSATLQLLVKIAGWIRRLEAVARFRLYPARDGHLGIESSQNLAAKQNRLQIMRYLEPVHRVIKNALDDLDKQAGQTQRVQEAAEKDRRIREARERSEWEILQEKQREADAAMDYYERKKMEETSLERQRRLAMMSWPQKHHQPLQAISHARVSNAHASRAHVSSINPNNWPRNKLVTLIDQLRAAKGIFPKGTFQRSELVFWAEDLGYSEEEVVEQIRRIQKNARDKSMERGLPLEWWHAAIF